MAYIVVAYVVMAYLVMAYLVMVYLVMAYLVMAYLVMAYLVTAHIVMAWLPRFLDRKCGRVLSLAVGVRDGWCLRFRIRSAAMPTRPEFQPFGNVDVASRDLYYLYTFRCGVSGPVMATSSRDLAPRLSSSSPYR